MKIKSKTKNVVDRYPVRHTLPISYEMETVLKALERKIATSGGQAERRTTMNSVMRCLIEAGLTLECDWECIHDESDLRERIFQAMGPLPRANKALKDLMRKYQDK